MTESQPVTVGALLDDEQLGRPAVLARAPQPGWDDARRVQDNDVGGLDEIGKIREATVSDSTGGAVEYEQAGGGAFGERLLGDQFRGKIVLEIGGAVAQSKIVP